MTGMQAALQTRSIILASSPDSHTKSYKSDYTNTADTFNNDTWDATEVLSTFPFLYELISFLIAIILELNINIC
jgi:hypothetical protein